MYKDYMIIKRHNNHDLDLEIIDKRTLEQTTIIKREVVRGVIIKGDKILLVYLESL